MRITKLINTPVLKNMVGSVVFKIISSVISFITVPLLLSVLGVDNYAIWVTSTSLLAWISLFDFGVGYSLKNKVSEYIALKNWESLYNNVAATIQFLLLATIILFICFLGAFFFVDIFKDYPTLIIILYLPFILSFSSICGSFILQGQGKFMLLNIIQLIQPFIWLIFILLCYNSGSLKDNLLLYAVIYSLSVVLVRLLIFIISLRSIRFPSNLLLKFKSIKIFKAVVLSGSKFFILQVSSLIVYSIGNVLIYDNLELEQVAQYDTINKIFLLGMTFFNIIIAIIWTEISKAKALINKAELRRNRHNLYIISLLYSLACISLIYICPQFIPFWTKGKILVSTEQIVPFVILAAVQSFAYAGAVFLNAFEKLKAQIILSILSAILMIPLANIFFNYNWGITSIPLTSAIVTLPALLYCFVESKRCINNLK